MPTTLTRLLPLLLLLILLSIIGFIAYAIYTVATAVKTQTEKRMEKKHVVMTKDGMRVGVKEVGREGYVDRTQSILVQAWNFSSWTGGWWGQQQQQQQEEKGGERRRGR
ncbi:MAG: hypothetical protein LQ349_002545 [Xanthoria aureola]|nr:MAG: hypothetical protein LQ349_002545 [Xanthoria aureola]